MAHRALVAYRDDDRYHLHYAHRGSGVGATISLATPFGGREDVDDNLPARFDLDPVDRYVRATRVDPCPLAREVSAERVLAALDRSIESLVVVDWADEVDTYLVCSLGVDGDGPLVVAGPSDDEAALRRTLVTAKDRLGERVDAGRLTEGHAERAVRHILETRVSVHSLDDASFLRTE